MVGMSHSFHLPPLIRPCCSEVKLGFFASLHPRFDPAPLPSPRIPRFHPARARPPAAHVSPPAYLWSGVCAPGGPPTNPPFWWERPCPASGHAQPCQCTRPCASGPLSWVLTRRSGADVLPALGSTGPRRCRLPAVLRRWSWQSHACGVFVLSAGPRAACPVQTTDLRAAHCS